MAQADRLNKLGENLRAARRRKFPDDGVRGFASRIGVSTTTLVKMEQGKLSVSLANYYEAAKVLGLESQFDSLFVQPDSLFED